MEERRAWVYTTKLIFCILSLKSHLVYPNNAIMNVGCSFFTPQSTTTLHESLINVSLGMNCA